MRRTPPVMRPVSSFETDLSTGAVRPGADADLVILDPDREWRITEDSLQYLNRISAFVGLEGRGVPETVLVRGQVVWGGGAVRVSPGYGELVRRQTP